MRRDRVVYALAILVTTGCVPSPNAPPPRIRANPEAPPVAPVAPSPEEAQPAPTPTPPPPPAPPPAPAPASAPAPAPAPVPAKPIDSSKSTTRSGAGAAAKTDALMTEVLASGGAVLKSVLAAPERHRFQVLYGAIVTKNGKPVLERHAYRADAEYFFPASSMKVPIAFAAYERLAALRGAGTPALTRDTTLRIHPVAGSTDPWVTTLAREARRALIVSDNFSANRLLAFVGHRELHETLWSHGLASSRVHTGFATGAELDPATLSPPIDLVVDGATAERLPARKSDLVLPATDAAGLAIGVANIVDGRRVDGPLSFADKNAMKLRDLQDALVRIMRPELAPAATSGNATKARAGMSKARVLSPSPEDLEQLRSTLGTLPSESGLAGFDRNVVADYQLSPFLRGIERVRSRGRFDIHSKVGQAYGFLVHNAYVVDKETGRAFFLIASIYANPDETMNSDRYAYDSVSFPALADVGEAFARRAFMP